MKKNAKSLWESFGIVNEKLRKTMEESLIVWKRTKMQHESIKEEMYIEEKFFMD